MMFAIGCIQALKCNTNHCPVGVATQDPALMRGLDPADKAERVRGYHARTVEAMYELLGAAGLTDPTELTPRHIRCRAATAKVTTYEELFPLPSEGCLLRGVGPDDLTRWWDEASVERFGL